MDSYSKELSEDDLASVNAFLSEIVRESGWTRTTAIGELIVSRMFCGAVDALGEPGRVPKHHSIRKLASRADCPLKKSALAQAIAVYAAVQKEPRLRRLAGITPAHVGVVLALPSEERHELLKRAESEKWSVRVLAKMVSRPASSDADEARSATLRHALIHYRNSLKSAQVALRILKQQEQLDPSSSKEVGSLIRGLTLAVSEAADVVRAANRGTSSQEASSQPDAREKPVALMLAGIGLAQSGTAGRRRGTASRAASADRSSIAGS